jgi:hypothetical protein
LSALIEMVRIWTLLSCGKASLETLGRSTFTPWLSMGAVTMKMTSSTSITSM